MKWWGGALAAMIFCGLAALPQAAQAQRTDENAVANADDAFGMNVGTESVGIYTERDTRGFNPLDAGNARIDGIYYDPVGVLSGRLRESTTIRVGTASEGFPFHAPTGIVDYKLRPFPSEFGNSVSYFFSAFGGNIRDWDLRLPLIDGKLGLTGGLAMADLRQSSGSRNVGWGWTVRPIIRLGSTEIAPYASQSSFHKTFAAPLVVLSGTDVPELPKQRRVYLGQDWARGNHSNDQYGITVKSRITERVSLRGGLFYATSPKARGFSEIFLITGPGGQARHLLSADPHRAVHSTSGEGTLALRLGGQKVQHRIFVGYRARNRLTETGGSQRFDFGSVTFGEFDPEPEPQFNFTDVSAGRVRQSALMLGYIGSVEGLGQLNLGIQKGRYRAQFRDSTTGLIDRTRASPWLYNATLTVHITSSLSAYVGSERGLEDSGVAPESATNKGEQLPATLATQYEGGLRWKFTGGQFILNAFQITKPYFSFDGARNFVELGRERHRGIEASLSGHFGERFNLLAGVVAMKAQVTGAAVDRGELGRRPAGRPAVHARIDAHYRTDIFGGLTPTASLAYNSSRAASSRPFGTLGGKQVTLPGFAALDLGLRQKFKIGSVPFSFRAVVDNVFDKKAWKVVAADTLFSDGRRRFSIYVAADF
ncbi:MAG: TonB-dependent receptor [Novosphingobium sp.]|nr:TonB-dependent receptor [Novosphingobium sp.]